ncbi:hypothetical protein [Streptomyces sp. NPDC002491]
MTSDLTAITDDIDRILVAASRYDGAVSSTVEAEMIVQLVDFVIHPGLAPPSPRGRATPGHGR